MRPDKSFVPSREFIDSLASWSWVEEGPLGPSPFVMLTRAWSPAGELALRGLADLLRLGRSRQDTPDCGARVGLLDTRRAALRVDRCRHAIGVRVGTRWQACVREGGPVTLLVGLAPLAGGADHPEVASYLERTIRSGELRVGVAGLLSGTTA